MKRLHILVHVAIIATGFFILCRPANGTDIDAYAEIDVPESLHPGSSVPIQVDYGNLGPTTSFHSEIEILLPTGMPAPVSEITQIEMDNLLNSFSDSMGNSARISVDETCTRLKITVSGPPNPWGEPGLQDLSPGAEGSFQFNLEAPEQPVAAVVRILEPPELRKDYLWGTGICDEDCENCAGARLDSFPAEFREWELVYDGIGRHVNDGCNPFIGFHPGNVAVVLDSRLCQTRTVAYNALSAGAFALVMLSQDSSIPDSVYNKDNQYWNSSYPPLVVLSYNDGQAIESVFRAGKSVHGMIGRAAPSRLKLDTVISSWDENDLDFGNNVDDAWLELEIGVFADSFETGDPSRWSFITGE